MKIMIIGAAGFIGSTTAAYLLKHSQHSVVSIDDLSTTPDVFNLEPALRATSRHSFHIADAADRKIMKKILSVEKPDLVIFAIELDMEGLQTITGFESLGSAAGVSKTIVVCSEPGHEGQYKRIDRFPDLRALPNHILVSTCRIFGPRQNHRHFLPTIIQKNIGIVKFDIRPGEVPQEWLYIGEFFKALLAIISSTDPAPHYCVSSGQVATEVDIANMVYSIVKDVQIDEEFSVVVSNTLDTSEIKKLGWEPTQNLFQAIEHTTRWFSDNLWTMR